MPNTTRPPTLAVDPSWTIFRDYFTEQDCRPAHTFDAKKMGLQIYQLLGVLREG